MSRKSTLAKAVVTLETRSVAGTMDGVHKAIESGVVDVQTIATLRKLLAPQTAATASITISSSVKSPALASSRAKKSTRTTERVKSTVVVPDPRLGVELVCGTKTVIMKSLHTLGSLIETGAKASDTTPAPMDAKGSKQQPSQAIKNILTCCKTALDALRQWQDHQDIDSSWVNTACFGYIGKLIAFEMVSIL